MLPDEAVKVLAAVLLLGMLVLAVGAVAAKPWWIERRRARQRTRAFAPAWHDILQRRVPLAQRLPAELHRRLEGHVQVFLAEKPFIGCRGQVIDDEVRVTIAALACMPLLGHERPDVYPRLRQVLVYPDAFVVDRELPVGAGLVQAQRRTLSGESWDRGQVILAWSEVLAGAADPADGRNVVLHEFAHQIDQDKGTADGRPWRPGAAARQRWAAVMNEAFWRLRDQPSPVIDAYGASEPAEFFAVVTEAFFERAHELAAEAPAVYAELAGLYRLDPRLW